MTKIFSDVFDIKVQILGVNHMQVQRINNYQSYTSNKSYNVRNSKISHNVTFGIKPVIDRSSSPVLNLPVDYVFELSRSRLYKPNIFIGEGLYYGDVPSCVTRYCIEILKEAGIKTVIDLEHVGGKYKEIVEDTGLKYYGYSVSDNVFSDNYRNNEKKDKLIDFIKEMQKDNIYVSGNTVMRRDIAALINQFFNPNFNGRARLSRDFIEFVSHVESFAKEIYGCMTPEDKKSIGWTREFEDDFKKRVFGMQ